MDQGHMHIHGTYDSLLVLFSYVVAVVASYTVLDMVGKISETKGRNRLLWLLFGASAMGMGIWSMHFVGMLAFKLPVPVAYDFMYILLSVIAALVASFIALRIVSGSTLTIRSLLLAGVLLACGISAMHYIGMAAMQIHITYDRFWFTASIVIALAASIAALWLALYFRKGGAGGGRWKKLGSGLVMGFAIVGMHYTGMWAANFHLGDYNVSSSSIMLERELLAYLIAGGTLLTLGLSLLSIVITRRMSYKDSEIEEKTAQIYAQNEQLSKLNEHLEELVIERTAQLESARDEAVRANQFKSQFLANMSHELRTPLNAIIGYSEMLMEEAEEMKVSEYVEDLAKIRYSGKHLLALINDILDISKIEAGKMELYIEACSLKDIVEDVLTTIKPLAESSGNELRWNVAEDGKLTTDCMKLKQILVNLLSNANKFTERGTIELHIRSESRGNRSGYCFQVKDTGIGMTARQLEKLFQPFTQADASTTRKYGGTGLGLAISHSFSGMLGGELDVDSEIGNGTTFTCWIPNA
ncbi:ATP-binding protein [Paenibacillus sp. J5C_2022]|uniref:MHYT domain-containing protein n=1 Tax=Paenibacillus sp. J5C2022 TaxID=2977129 RepID=UPI0021CF8334|nr:MHYT domain-containing protein [Paenibacillus sp. J5C2022]MCU6709618.1 ATP-binding protein [Paenibacillus sp. J5C2022]